ncbi:hypothetical protein [Paenibacillus sp. NEAU-GSW1]|uniref:hypothetical protein n=1 Tax=Paenibacillus sp. NEAU-GSW1 TaxID=2682486 RepID=UPI0012E31ACE|nr:hypothetical protein [Paenibacillus sp. NEAU-GSW1]MUT67818.1 hypothetical protein [Paenibacillus sp. NEAU-GSW1]
MLDAIQILKEVNELGATKTLAEVDAVLAAYDYPALRTAERTRFQVSLWDKVSPINGVPADVVGADVPIGGEVYLIHIDGNLVFMQKHDSEQMGFVAMDAQTATAKADAFIAQLVEEAIDTRLKSEVMRQLL